MSKWKQGVFKPKNPGKYRGDPSNIIYRSGWELKCMRYFDAHGDVLEWSSEELVVPYRSPLDGKMHRYFPDFWVKIRQSDGTVVTKILEVKPNAQKRPPANNGKITKRFIKETYTYAVNQAKWAAARSACADRGWKFEVLTEKELF